MSAADLHARAVLNEAIAQIELRLSRDREERARVEVSTESAIDNLRVALTDHTPDIGPVLEQVATMCALVSERLEADRIERRALTEAIKLLARPLAAPLEVQPRVIGGTVLASSEVLRNGEPIAIDGAVGVDDVHLEEPTRNEHAGDVIDLGDDGRVIDLVQEAADEDRSEVRNDVWDAFEQQRADNAEAREAVDLRQHTGTRLTARRPDFDASTR